MQRQAFCVLCNLLLLLLCMAVVLWLGMHCLIGKYQTITPFSGAVHAYGAYVACSCICIHTMIPLYVTPFHRHSFAWLTCSCMVVDLFLLCCSLECTWLMPLLPTATLELLSLVTMPLAAQLGTRSYTLWDTLFGLCALDQSLSLSMSVEASRYAALFCCIEMSFCEFCDIQCTVA